MKAARGLQFIMLRVACGKRTVRPIELFGHDDLAAETPRGLRQTESEVEHVLLDLGPVLQQREPYGNDDDVAGRPGERAFAGTFDIDVVAMRDLEHGEPDRRFDSRGATRRAE